MGLTDGFHMLDTLPSLKKSKVDFRLDFWVCALGRPARTAANPGLVTRGKSR